MTVPVEASDVTALFRHCWLLDRKPIDRLVYCLIWLAFNTVGVDSACTNGSDGHDRRAPAENGEDDVRSEKRHQEAGAVQVCRRVSSSISDQRRQTINCPRESTSVGEGETADCGARLQKSHSGGELCRLGRTAGAAAVPLASDCSPRLFSPFPRQYVNKRRLDNAIRLGLYTVDDASAASSATTSGPQRSAAASGARPARYPHS